MKREHLLYASLVAVVLTVSVFFVNLRQKDPSPDVTSEIADPKILNKVAPDAAVMFYVAEDGGTLVGVRRNIPPSNNIETRAKIVTEQQLSEAPGLLISVFPDGTRLRALYITDGGDAFVDLSSEVTLAHPGGSLDELFTVYALVNALTINVPQIRAVQILVEGKEVDTLAGHVDLRHPLERNMKWVSSSDFASEDEQSGAQD